jgi:hypothetical protein
MTKRFILLPGGYCDIFIYMPLLHFFGDFEIEVFQAVTFPNDLFAWCNEKIKSDHIPFCDRTAKFHSLETH